MRLHADQHDSGIVRGEVFRSWTEDVKDLKGPTIRRRPWSQEMPTADAPVVAAAEDDRTRDFYISTSMTSLAESDLGMMASHEELIFRLFTSH